ncbi:hypothetical protein CHS0354_002774 [Potamilus streckersoni]|uniref:Uncharacterized protein n=1 Tax=Potamilus streckersoni TaxID=2493646 RepID=A0AAE0SP22_9BIVA|nr:hypothetical protein CHS0354_002774 [Potamilus streckersoni]
MEKRPSYDLGGTSKRMAHEAILQENAIIQDAYEFFKWADIPSSKEVRFHLVEKCSIDEKKEGMDAVLTVVKIGGNDLPPLTTNTNGTTLVDTPNMNNPKSTQYAENRGDVEIMAEDFMTVVYQKKLLFIKNFKIIVNEWYLMRC